MILRNLRHYTVDAEEGSIVAAAARLRVAQPALSRQVQALERQLGEQLFERQARGVRLTPAGQALSTDARSIFHELEGAVRETRLTAAGMTGVVRVGLGRAALDSHRVGRALAAVGSGYPGVQLVVEEIPRHEHEAALSAGRIDVGIGMNGADPGDGMREAPLFADVIDSVMLPAAHPLAGGTGAVDLDELRGDRLQLLTIATAGAYPGLFRALGEEGITEWDEHGSIESVYTAVAAGNGWTMTTASLRPSAPPGTAVRPLHDFSVPVAMTAIWRASDDSRLVTNVVEGLVASGDGGIPSASRVVETALHRKTTDDWPNIELRQLRSLVATVREGSVSAAAEHLGLTQSGVSRQLRALERDLGCSLLKRKAKGVIATAAGAVLARRGAHVLSMLDAASVRSAHLRGSGPRVCRIGTLPPEMTDELHVRLQTHMARYHPEVVLEIREMLSGAQLVALREREIDVGIVGGYFGVVDDPTVATVSLSRDPLDCAVIAATHPLASRSWLTAEDLNGQPFFFISRSTSPGFYDAVFERLAEIGLIPTLSGEFNGLRAAWRMAADSDGWTIGPQSQRRNPPPGLRAIPIQGMSIDWGLRLIWRHGETDPAVQLLLQAIRDGLLPQG